MTLTTERLAVINLATVNRAFYGEKKYYLTPINPFTPAQRKILGYWISDGITSAVEIAQLLQRHKFTIKKQVNALFGIIETVTGERPRSISEALNALRGDVVLENTGSQDFYRALNRPTPLRPWSIHTRGFQRQTYLP